MLLQNPCLRVYFQKQPHTLRNLHVVILWCGKTKGEN